MIKKGEEKKAYEELWGPPFMVNQFYGKSIDKIFEQ